MQRPQSPRHDGDDAASKGLGAFERSVTLRSLFLHVLALAAIILVPSLPLGLPVWRIARIAKVFVLLAAAGYVACSVALIFIRRGEGRWAWLPAALVCGMILAPLSGLTVMPASDGARVTLLFALILAAALAWISYRLRQPGVLQTSAIVVLVALGGAAAVGNVFFQVTRISVHRPEVDVTSLNSNVYPLRFTLYRFFVKEPPSRGGALASLGDRFLLATVDGVLYTFDPLPERGGLGIQQLPYRIPINRDEFAADAGPEVRTYQFRVAGLLVHQRGETVQLYASYHFWHRAERCYVLRVSLLEGQRAQLLHPKTTPTWKTVYETSPCLPLKAQTGQLHFEGIESGGKLALLDDRHLLLTVGDHAIDGINTPDRMAQNPATSYGKTLLIDLETGTAQLYSLGHRNPEGLYIDAAGEIWSTEHGPQGGDELNHIERGKNYGWPIVTYGADYGTHSWPNSEPGTHVGYERPRYAWIPSVGLSGLTGITRDLFARWKGDLVIASLTGRTLWHVRVREDRVVFAEPIRLGQRIRDVLEAPDGRLILWTDSASIGILEPERELSTGAGLFATRCAGCHRIDDGLSHRIGPDLRGVVGRRIGSAVGFLYSRTLREKSGKWTDERLDEFLANPAAFASGTTMHFPGVPDPASRGKIIAYLAEGE